jgi:hypothetical protein
MPAAQKVKKTRCDQWRMLFQYCVSYIDKIMPEGGCLSPPAMGSREAPWRSKPPQVVTERINQVNSIRLSTMRTRPSLHTDGPRVVIAASGRESNPHRPWPLERSEGVVPI